MLSRYRKWLTLTIIVVVFVTLAACAWPLEGLVVQKVQTLVPTARVEAQIVQTRQPTQAPVEVAAAPAQSVTGLPSVASVAKMVRPAVVQIANEQMVTDFYQQVPQTETAGIGSGVIYDNQGHILTNYHVIAGSQQLTVALPDGRHFPGKIIGSDRDTDLAVIQIQGDNLPVAQLGQSSSLEVGDWVVAIGNALGLKGGPTVSAGVVSAMGRAVQEPSSDNQPGPYLYDLIQTDAAINPGNSGGPLVNLQGQVVGINTLVAGMAEPGVQAQGIGFAIAIDTAKPIADEIVATGHVTHPYVGIYYLGLNPALAAQLGTDQQSGIVIAQIGPGSPAEQAGLQVRDIIVGINGEQVDDESTFGLLMNKHKPGEQITFNIIRDNRKMNVSIKLGQRTSDQ